MNPALPAFNLLVLLCMGHLIADFGLQGDRMAREKCPGHDITLWWGWWLSSHAAMHGLLVALLTGLPLLGLAEWVVHAVIDLAKCRRMFSLTIDQVLHLVCKLLWVAIAVHLQRVPAWLH
ncbi:MAG: DUF3307 domain-containing protein [Synechococcaceae cyanobacterium]|nr:DUF3307 domain-containing protein [Synechococcaceae cyanobacterium]